MPSLHCYLIALGSNRRHSRYGGPRTILKAALQELNAHGINVVNASTVLQTDPVGPSIRQFANSAACVETALAPQELLDRLKGIEQKYGKRRGQRWSTRTLDLDIIAWDGGIFANPTLAIPHKLFRTRKFVLEPLNQIAPNWRDPLSGLTIRQIYAQLQKKIPKEVDRCVQAD